MKRILIVDDEKPARDRLRRLVDAMDDYEVAGEAINGSDALEQIRELTPDILLLDISMPGMDGMSLAHALQDSGAAPAIIFCTAYQDQALSAFEVEAVDYVVKPVRAERLEKALEKAGRYMGEESEDRDEQHFLRSTVGGKVELTPIGQVICLLAEDKYTTVIHEEGETVIDDSLTELEQRFPELFFRVHRNALVALGHVLKLERNPGERWHVVLDGVDVRPVISRRHLSEAKQRLLQV